jgi:hypothetical protein
LVLKHVVGAFGRKEITKSSLKNGVSVDICLIKSKLLLGGG